jgi:hypothetical protein
MTEQPFDSWFDPIEPGLRDRTEDFPKTMFEAELEQTLARFRYARRFRGSPGLPAAATAIDRVQGSNSRSRAAPAELPTWQVNRWHEYGSTARTGKARTVPPLRA